MKQSSRIYAFGETVFEIVYSSAHQLAAHPGGSSLNAAVSLSRLQAPVSFISEWGEDKLGEKIQQRLQTENLNTGYTYRYKDGRTPLSIAFLDEEKEASYSFYRAMPEQRFQVEIPGFQPSDYLLFGSYFAVDPAIRKQVSAIIDEAYQKEATLLYDPNIRKPHARQLNQILPSVRSNLSKASLVRGSAEDFRLLFKLNKGQDTYDYLRKMGVDYLIYTNHLGPVECFTPAFSFQTPVQAVEPLSTIGAGDNFNAGVLYYMYQHAIGKARLPELTQDIWEEMIQSGIRIAAASCLRYENYVGRGFYERIR